MKKIIYGVVVILSVLVIFFWPSKKDYQQQVTQYIVTNSYPSSGTIDFIDNPTLMDINATADEVLKRFDILLQQYPSVGKYYIVFMDKELAMFVEVTKYEYDKYMKNMVIIK